MKALVRFGPAIIWMAVIFYLSHQRADDLNSLLPLFQQWLPWMSSFDWGHFALYFILGLAYHWALLPRSQRLRGKSLVVLLCICYGITDEWHQSFVPGRTPDLLDLRNDAIGAALAMLTVSLPPFARLYERLTKVSKKY